MKITPLDIKQKSFTIKSFGKGYDRDEVHAFLNMLAQNWELQQDEAKELKIRIDLLEKEIQKLKEVETSLFRTLKTAEETSANIIDQARKNAELKVREAQIKSDVILNDARAQAKAIVQKAQVRSRNTIEELVNEMKLKEREYKELETFKQNFVIELRNFMNETIEKLGRFEHKKTDEFYNLKIQEAQELLEERNQILDEQDFLNEQESEKAISSYQIDSKAENTVTFNIESERTNEEENNSFFDNLKE